MSLRILYQPLRRLSSGIRLFFTSVLFVLVAIQDPVLWKMMMPQTRIPYAMFALCASAHTNRKIASAPPRSSLARTHTHTHVFNGDTNCNYLVHPKSAHANTHALGAAFEMADTKVHSVVQTRNIVARLLQLLCTQHTHMLHSLCSAAQKTRRLIIQCMRA